MTQIRFGTDGWRGVISREITFANIALLAAAFAEYLKENEKSHLPIAIGYDRRFLSREYAEEAACVVAARGIKVLLSEDHCPTPCVSFNILKEQAAGGMVITASNSPAIYSGVKLRADYGGPAPEIMTTRVVEIAAQLEAQGASIEKLPLAEAKRKGRIVLFNPRNDYTEHLMARVDWRAIQVSGFRPIIDSMFGAGAGYTDYILGRIGLRPTVIRQTYTPGFMGVQPEPVAANLHALSERVIAEHADVGLATDGDADRVGIVDENGDYVSSQCVMALLLQHLVEDKGCRKGRIVKTVSSTSMIDKLCKRYELECIEVEVGFRQICQRMLKGGVLLGCEESGGFGLVGHIPERDAILVSLLILEMMSLRKKRVGEMVNDLFNLIGYHAFERVDCSMDEEERSRVLQMLRESPPAIIAGHAVQRVDTLDGFKFYLDDESWLLIRPSGSTPILRLYAESPSDDRVWHILESAQETLGLGNK